MSGARSIAVRELFAHYLAVPALRRRFDFAPEPLQSAPLAVRAWRWIAEYRRQSARRQLRQVRQPMPGPGDAPRRVVAARSVPRAVAEWNPIRRSQRPAV